MFDMLGISEKKFLFPLNQMLFDFNKSLYKNKNYRIKISLYDFVLNLATNFI